MELPFITCNHVWSRDFHTARVSVRCCSGLFSASSFAARTKEEGGHCSINEDEDFDVVYVCLCYVPLGRLTSLGLGGGGLRLGNSLSVTPHRIRRESERGVCGSISIDRTGPLCRNTATDVSVEIAVRFWRWRLSTGPWGHGVSPRAKAELQRNFGPISSPKFP